MDTKLLGNSALLYVGWAMQKMSAWWYHIFIFLSVFLFFQVNIYFVILVGLGGRNLTVHIFLLRLECLRTRLGYSHWVQFTFTFLFSFCSYFGNALIQHCNFMKSFMKMRRLQKKKKKEQANKKNTLTRNVSLHVYYASLKQSKKQPSKASWSTWKKTFTIIISIVIKCCGLYCTSETSVISQQCICYESDRSFGFFRFSFFHFCHLWLIVELKIFLLNYFLKSKLKQYPFRDPISCIIKHQWCVRHSILSPFQL